MDKLLFIYNESKDNWDVIGFLPTSRYGSLVEVSGSQLVVIGGWLKQFHKSDIVEVGTINI